MKARLTGWDVEQLGPATSTRQEHADGSVSYEAIHNVTLRFTVVGNDAMEFLQHVQNLRPGTPVQAIQFGAPLSEKLSGLTKGRKYVFE